MTPKTLDNESIDTLCGILTSVMAEFLCCELTSDKVRDIARVYKEVVSGVKFEPLIDSIDSK